MRLSRLLTSLLFAVAMSVGVPSAMARGGAAASPSIEGVMLDGAPFSLTKARGDVVVVNFWATWCTPCRAELPAFDAVYATRRAKGLRLLAISMDDPVRLKAVRAVAASLRFPVAMVGDTRLAHIPQPSSLPVTLVFDRQGALRFDSRTAKSGALNGAAIEHIVDPLLGEAAGR